MSKVIDITNKSAFLYSSTVADKVKQICFPLEKYLGIFYFEYIRFFKDCSYLLLVNGFEEFLKQDFEISSNPKYATTSLEVHKRLPITNRPQYIFWPRPQICKDPLYSLFHSYNIWNGFTIAFKTKDYFEGFSFTFNRLSDDKTNFFLRNIDLLNVFVKYFKNTAEDLINCNNKHKLATFKCRTEIENVWHKTSSDSESLERKEFLNNLKQKNNFSENKNSITFSPQEQNCLTQIAMGKTAKEVGRILNLSHRTVESYIEHAKNKVGCNYKSQLIEAFLNNHNTSLYE